MFYKENIQGQNLKNIFEKIDLARAFLSERLPQKTQNLINLDTLKIADPKFVASIPPTKRAADVLFSVRGTKGRDSYIFICLENRNANQASLILSLFEYKLAIIKAYLEQGNSNYPLVIPFLYYYGLEEWTGPRSLAEVFGTSNLEEYFRTRTYFIPIEEVLKRAKS